LPTLDEFRTFFLEKVDSFNRRDWAAVLDELPESFEWHFPAEVVDRSGPAKPSELRAALDDLVSPLPDLKAEPIEIVEPGPNAFVVRLLVHGAGAASGAAIRLELSQLWTFEDGVPVRVREFTSFTDAMSQARQ
jgi:ketosteroid isomerase-like protein